MVGAVLVVLGFGLLSTIDHETNMVLLGSFLFVLGVGIGMTMQNLVLAVQNTVAATDLGAASSAVAFFRSLGGTIGVSVLGAVLSSHVGDLIRQGLAGIPGAAQAASSGSAVGLADFSRGAAGHPHPDPRLLRRRDRPDLPDLGGHGGRRVVVASCFIREVALRTQSGDSAAARPRGPRRHAERNAGRQRSQPRGPEDRRPASRDSGRRAVVVVSRVRRPG